jgi:hypothetical protein
LHPNGLYDFEKYGGKLDAWGDYELLRIGDTYYLFADDHPEGGRIGFGYWYSDDINGEFTYGGMIREGQHPDPTIGFAEGEFVGFLQGDDVRSRGPWADGVEAQVGVDVNDDGTIDRWTPWQKISETYTRIPGFAKVFGVVPATRDLSDLPEGYAIQFRFRVRHTEAVLTKLTVHSSPVSDANPAHD